MAKRLSFVLAIAMFVIMAGCTKPDPVALVQNGTIELDKSVTVGNALGRYTYFKSANWKAEEDAQKRMIVSFQGIPDFDKYPGTKIEYFPGVEITTEMVTKAKKVFLGKQFSMVYTVEFAISQDRKTFQVTNAYYRMSGNDPKTGKPISEDTKDDKYEIFSAIYKNNPDPTVFGLIFTAGRQ
jgi:hypothetical protein